MLLLILVGSSAAVAYHLLGGTVLSLPFSSQGTEGNASADAGEENWDVKCREWNDPADPRRSPDYRPVLDSEIVRTIGSQPENVEDYVRICSEMADALDASGSAEKKAEADRLHYDVSRFQKELGLDDDYRQNLTRLADRYPAAAYKLAKLLAEQSTPDLRSATFVRIYDLYSFAHRGGDRRAQIPLLELANQVYTLDEFSLPTLFAAMYSGKFDAIPDSSGTRIAAWSMWQNYRQRCEAWEVFPLQPADDAAIKSFMVPVQAGNYLSIAKSVPRLAGQVKDWFENIGSNSFIGIWQDLVRARAYPDQMLFLVNTAAGRDGSHIYDKFTCSGPHAQRVYNNMLTYFRERTRSSPGAPTPDDVDQLARRPDLATLI